MDQEPTPPQSGATPYELMAEAAITPQSSIAEIRQGFTYFLRHAPRRRRRVRDAFDQLTVADKRLVVDFFLYWGEGPPDEEGADG